MTEEEVRSLLTEMLYPELGRFLAERAAKRLWEVADALGQGECLAVLAVAYDMAIGELVKADG